MKLSYKISLWKTLQKMSKKSMKKSIVHPLGRSNTFLPYRGSLWKTLQKMSKKSMKKVLTQAFLCDIIEIAFE